MKYDHSTGLFKSEQPEIIAETQSGKQVLAGSADSYSGGFSDQDHLDAKKIHEQKASHHDQTARNSMLNQKMFNHRRIAAAQAQAEHHRKQAEWHEQQLGQKSGQNDPIEDQPQEDVQKSKKESFKQKLTGGLADKKKPSDFDSKALQAGVKVEMEHTDDPNKAKEIAMDHLTEDPKYYEKLKTIEKGYSPDLTGKDTLFFEEHPEEKKKIFRDKLAKKQGVPKGVDPDKHERCVKDVKKQGKDKSSAYAICNASMKKAFRENLLKGGPGSGRKGHQTFKPRKPWPGEKTQENRDMNQPQQTHVPSGGFQEHYTDTPELKAYKKFVSYLKKEGHDFTGHISFDKEKGHITAISDKGKELIADAKKRIADHRESQGLPPIESPKAEEKSKEEPKKKEAPKTREVRTRGSKPTPVDKPKAKAETKEDSKKPAQSKKKGFVRRILEGGN